MSTTEVIMQMALDLVGMQGIPGDSAIYYPSQGTKKVLFGIDISTAGLALAKQLGYDAVIAHHPPETQAIPAWKAYLRHVDLLVQADVPREAAVV